jgi:hypothetical protein
MSQQQRVQGRNTSVFTDDSGALCCVYHSTIVARKAADGRTVELNTGGWKSATTKTRMNQFANQHCGGKFSVYQKNGNWYVDVDGGALQSHLHFTSDKLTVRL